MLYFPPKSSVHTHSHLDLNYVHLGFMNVTISGRTSYPVGGKYKTRYLNSLNRNVLESQRFLFVYVKTIITCKKCITLLTINVANALV